MSSDPIPSALTAAALDERRELEFPRSESGDLGLRLRRATSWLQRAEQETDDPDAAFIFYWIAFNSLYAEDRPEIYEVRERDAFRLFFDKVVPLDRDNEIYNAIWDRFSGPIRIFLENKFVFHPFWTSLNRSAQPSDWGQSFDNSRDRISRAMGDQNTAVILNELFDRLYVLRNQIMHGGATWQSSVNRNQVRDGAAIMAFLTPGS